MLLGVDFAAASAGTELELANVVPVDVPSPFQTGRNATNPFDVAASVAIPYLVAESLSYRFGRRDNASQSISLKGDSLFYASASAYTQVAVGTNVASQTVALANPVLPYNGDTVNGTRYALGVSLKSGRRLAFGADYTETVTGAGTAKQVSVVVLTAVPVTDSIRVIYQSPTVAVYQQASHAVASATRPAAIKGRDIEVRIGGRLVTDRWSSIQAVTAEMRFELEKDEEFGNAQAVARDFDVPVVTGTVEVKPARNARCGSRTGSRHRRVLTRAGRPHRAPGFRRSDPAMAAPSM